MLETMVSPAGLCKKTDCRQLLASFPVFFTGAMGLNRIPLGRPGECAQPVYYLDMYTCVISTGACHGESERD